MPTIAAKKLVNVEVKKPSRRSSFFLHSVIRRIPGYAFFLIHLCFVHILWGQLVDQLFTASLSFRAGNVSTTDAATLLLRRLSKGFRRTVDQTLVYGLMDAVRVKRNEGTLGVVDSAQECLKYLWKSPSSMVFFFGLTFIALNLLLTTVRLIGAFFSSLTSPCRSRTQVERGGSQRPIPLHIIARYGNGYDSVLRFLLAAVELTWFMSYPVLNFAAALNGAMDKAGTGARKTEPTYASLRQLQARQQAIASFQIEASLLLPPQLFDDTAKAVEAGHYVLLFVKMALSLVVAVDAQRLFHALVGVRPLSIPNGWERCPVCGALWKNSRTAKDSVHICPIIFATEPLTAVSPAASKSRSAMQHGAPLPPHATHALVPVPPVRPGDAFPDPDTASAWGIMTDSWLSPLMNFTLLSPFGTFSPPSISSITDDGRGYWKTLLNVVNRLPPMPHALRTQDKIGDPAWELWKHRHDPPAPGEVSWLESTFMSLTAPVRRVLSHAFAIFFLPSAAKGPAAPWKKGKGSALFNVFLRHTSGREFVYVCVPLKITQDLLCLVAPRVIKSLVAFLKEVSTSGTSTRKSYLSDGLLICLYLILAVMLQALFFQFYLTHLYASALKAGSALKMLLLRQSLETPLAYASGGDGGAAKKTLSSPRSPLSDGKKKRGGLSASTASKSGAALAAAASSAASQSREGEVASLLTVDTTNCSDCLVFLHNVWGHPFLIVSSLMSMYTYVGLFSTLATFAALIALIPFNRSSAARVRVAAQQAKNNESRLSDLTAALSAMRTVKSMALEECLMARIQAAREKESEGMKIVGRAESVAAAQTEVTTLLVALVCCGSYLLTGGKMDASVLVPTMAALQVMRFPLWTLPHLYSQVSRGYTSMQRIERYLTEHETGEEASNAYVAQSQSDVTGEGGERVSAKASPRPSPPQVKVGEVRCDRSTFAWNTQQALAEPMAFASAVSQQSISVASNSNGSSTEKDRTAVSPPAPGESSSTTLSLSFSTQSSPVQSASRTIVLHDVSLDVAPGEFVVVQGSTGSGKSALLLAILKELYVLPNEPGGTAAAVLNPGFCVGGRVGYCAEIPWLRQGTVRENIRLLPDDAPESAKERKWYKRVLEACALEQDLNVLANGDRTMVGEGGTKLSGGQRARVALARAAYRYRETDVFIFDDVLSALDVEVQKHIIAKLFHGLLCGNAASNGPNGSASSAHPRRTKTIIFATHVPVNLLLPDRVFYLWADGTLHEATAYTPPTPEQINVQKSSWRLATAAAAEAKDNRRSKHEAASGAAPAATSAPAHGTASTATPPPAPKPVPVGVTAAPAGIGFLLPRASDLHRLFIVYTGGSRLLLFFILSLAMQLFRTLMDNWLGVYISLYDKRNAAFASILSSTKSQRARKFLVDALSLIVLRGEKSAPAVAVTPPPVPLFAVWGYPVFWKNPFVLDTVVAQFLGTYAVIGLSAALLSMLRTDYFFRSYQRMADALQLHAVRKLFAAPVSYFDRIPSSRLLQVLSRDQEVVDRALGESVQLIFLTVLQLLGMVLFNTMHFTAFIAVLPISALLFHHLTVRFLSFTKQVRALEGVLQSRSLGVMKDAVKGAITIRAFGGVMQNQLQSEMNEALDAVHTAANAGLTADRWVALRLEFVALAFTSALAVLSVLTVCLSATTSSGSAAFAGLGIISSMTASRSLSMLCRRFGMFQNQFVSAEQLLRLEEEIPQEEDTAESCHSSEEMEGTEEEEEEGKAAETHALTPSSAFPLLDVRHLCAKYQPQLPWVLTDICFQLRPGECVGLIGRTGNGKSSLFNALLGLMDVVEGEILVPEGLVNAGPQEVASQQPSKQVNALQLPKHKLRKHYFELVSQEPLLLQGTCRSNLLLGYSEEPTEDGNSSVGGSARETSSDDGTASAATEAQTMEERLREAVRVVALDEFLVPAPVLPVAGSLATLEAGGENASAAPQQPLDDVEATRPLMDPAARALDHVVTAGGSNMSAGQRQLLCLARAVLHHPRVVLLDEVSSRVDRRTDELIQKVIKEEMLNRRADEEPGASTGDKSGTSGVLLIAHRLETIIALCDSVIVIAQGRCVAHLTKDEVSSLDDLESYL